MPVQLTWKKKQMAHPTSISHPHLPLHVQAQERLLSKFQDRLEGANAGLNKSEELRQVLQKQASDLLAQVSS